MDEFERQVVCVYVRKSVCLCLFVVDVCVCLSVSVTLCVQCVLVRVGVSFDEGLRLCRCYCDNDVF